MTATHIKPFQVNDVGPLFWLYDLRLLRQVFNRMLIFILPETKPAILQPISLYLDQVI